MPRVLNSNDRQGLAIHVHAAQTQSQQYVSNFWSLVREARYVAHRDLETGSPTYLEGERPQTVIWAASLLYMVLLDQIGSAFEPQGEPPADIRAPGFKRALELFAPRVVQLTSTEQDALYALRCSFDHDFSLVNQPDNQRHLARYAHLFRLVWSLDRPLVELPPNPWNGTINAFTTTDRTTINLKAFEELVEGVVSVIQELARADQLELGSDLTAMEFTIRYSMNVT